MRHSQEFEEIFNINKIFYLVFKRTYKSFIFLIVYATFLYEMIDFFSNNNGNYRFVIHLFGCFSGFLSGFLLTYNHGSKKSIMIKIIGLLIYSVFIITLIILNYINY